MLTQDWYAIHIEEEKILGPFPTKAEVMTSIHPDERMCVVMQTSFETAVYVFNIMIKGEKDNANLCNK
jgi:hypothetical protein